jgi:hypothetical protein
MDNYVMSKKIVSAKTVHESWGPALKESGFQYTPVVDIDEAVNSEADFYLIDARESSWVTELKKLKDKTKAPILSLINSDIPKEFLNQLRTNGSNGCIAENTPAEEVVVRIQAILRGVAPANIESRAAKRVWFQQKVDFTVFDKKHEGWSTTLSETGIFIHTPLSFPLYSVIQLKFDLWGEGKPFECEGVIVRHEVEGEINGVGVMFQNLKGDAVRALESFLDIYR